MHRPARYMHLQALASELEAQAATWHLVWCLHCCPDAPAGGSGGPQVAGAPTARTSRHALADALLSDPALARCAAVVAWLESLADDALGSDMVGSIGGGGGGGGGTNAADGYSSHEGVWLETQRRLGAGGMVSELDPDAPGRQRAALHPDNAAAEERLLARCWKLVRAGRHGDAQALWAACGSPWRAASMAGACGAWGPLPVGLAAAALEEAHAEAGEQLEELGGEVAAGGGAGAPRALWRWTCLQAALAATAAGGPGTECVALR